MKSKIEAILFLIGLLNISNVQSMEIDGHEIVKSKKIENADTNKNIDKYKNYYPEQIAALSKKERDKVITKYLLAAQKGVTIGIENIYAMELNSLMYSGIHDYKNAVLSFQKDLGDTATGKLTVNQIWELDERSQMQRLAPIGFPNEFSNFLGDGYARINGTLILEGENIAYPINHVRIECFKSENTCKTSQIKMAVPKKNDWAQSYDLLFDEVDVYTIAEWNENSIETKPIGGSSDCRKTSLSLNFSTGEFYSITRNAGGDCSFLIDSGIQPLSKPRIAKIINGEEIIDKNFQEVMDKAYQVLSSDFKKRIEMLSGKKN